MRSPLPRSLLAILLAATIAAAASPEDTATHSLEQRDEAARRLLAASPGDTLPPLVEARLREHINAVFDFPELSRLALGDHWTERTAEEQSHFVATFSGIIQEQNFDSFLRYYREGQINYQSEETDGKLAKVTALVPLKREQIEIQYLLRAVEGRWRIYDLVIDGVSTAEGNRRRYARYIEKHSYEQLMQQLDAQLARLRGNEG